jgi:hypothetical protein
VFRTNSSATRIAYRIFSAQRKINPLRLLAYCLRTILKAACVLFNDYQEKKVIGEIFIKLSLVFGDFSLSDSFARI